MSIQLTITPTGRNYGFNQEFKRFGEPERFSFPSIPDAKLFLKKRYGNCKRQPMYIDLEDGKTIKCGWIFCFHNADLSHAPVQKWIQQDWVSFDTLNPVEI